jgi:transposase
MNPTPTVAGIDVGSQTLVLAIRKNGKTHKPREFGNDPEGHAALAQALRQAKAERVCLEATGVYHLDLAVVLHDAGLAVMVVNPKAARRFAEAMMSRAKTDPVDAALLAEFAERMPFAAWVRPADEVLALRAYARYLSALTGQRAQMKNQLHAWEQSRATPAAIVEAVRGQIQNLTVQIELIQATALQLILGRDALSGPYRLLVSVKGIALASAIALLGELLVLPEGMTARQWVAMAGLDPRPFQSGHSVNKKPRISKAGNRHLRHALYMPALSALTHDPHLRGFYEHLVQRGLKKIQAVCAVMRKLLTALHAMLAAKAPFDGKRLFALPTDAVAQVQA